MNLNLHRLNLDIEKYHHFSFDLWLTLIRSNPNYKARRSELFRDFFSIAAPITGVQEAIRYYDILSNKMSEFTGTHIDRKLIYLMILNKLNVKIDYVDEYVFDQFLNLNDQLFLEYKPELIYANTAQTMMEIASEGKSISILSNTGFIHGEKLSVILEYYGIKSYINFEIYSDTTGMAKPNKALFELVYNKVKNIKMINRNEILHIGDNKIADFLGAKNFGFEAKLVVN